jgi:hypothetical protein
VRSRVGEEKAKRVLGSSLWGLGKGEGKEVRNHSRCSPFIFYSAQWISRWVTYCSPLFEGGTVRGTVRAFLMYRQWIQTNLRPVQVTLRVWDRDSWFRKSNFSRSLRWCLVLRDFPFIIFFCGAGDWTLGLVYAKQVLYYWAIMPSQGLPFKSMLSSALVL